MNRYIAVMLVITLLLFCFGTSVQQVEAYNPIVMLLSNPAFMFTAASFIAGGLVLTHPDAAYNMLSGAWNAWIGACQNTIDWINAQISKNTGYVDMSEAPDYVIENMQGFYNAVIDNSNMLVTNARQEFGQSTILSDQVLRIVGMEGQRTYVSMSTDTMAVVKWDNPNRYQRPSLRIMQSLYGGQWIAHWKYYDAEKNHIESLDFSSSGHGYSSQGYWMNDVALQGRTLDRQDEIQNKVLYYTVDIESVGTKPTASAGYSLYIDGVYSQTTIPKNYADVNEFQWVLIATPTGSYKGTAVPVVPTGAVAVPKDMDQLYNVDVTQNPATEIELINGQTGTITADSVPVPNEDTGIISWLGTFLSPMVNAVKNIWAWAQGLVGALIVAIGGLVDSTFMRFIPPGMVNFFNPLWALLLAILAFFARGVAWLVTLLNVAPSSSMLNASMLAGVEWAKSLSYGGVSLYYLCTATASVLLGLMVFRLFKRLAYGIGGA